MTEASQHKCNGCGTTWTAPVYQCPHCGLWETEYDRLKAQKDAILNKPPDKRPSLTPRTVRRFREVASTFGGGRMIEKETGEWVSYDDYSQLERELAEMAESREEWKLTAMNNYSAKTPSASARPTSTERMFDAMAWGDRITDEQLVELLERSAKSHTVKLRIDQFRDLVRQSRVAVMAPSEANEQFKEIAARAFPESSERYERCLVAICKAATLLPSASRVPPEGRANQHPSHGTRGGPEGEGP